MEANEKASQEQPETPEFHSDYNIYEKLSHTPDNALREIQNGRLKGKSDINPQYRYEAMTKEFGLCGTGWKYKVTSREFVPCGNGEVLCFVEIALQYVMPDCEWSEPVPGFGGSTLTANENRGPYNSDECIKMAVTDALSVAMKMIGIASDVYRGLTSHKPPQSQTKYDRPQAAAQVPVQPKETPKPPASKHLTEGTEQYAAAVQWVKAGGTDEEREKKFAAILKQYIVSAEVKQSIMNAAKAQRENNGTN